MPLSMYRLTVPVLQRGLATLSVYLDKAEAHASEKALDPTALVSAHLAPDMLPLSGQFQRASDTAKLTIARLAAVDAPSFEDSETTIPELRTRVAKTAAFLATIEERHLDGSDMRDVTIAPGGQQLTFRGDDYLASFALPNFYFHVATAHAILRQQGVAIGKRDYLGAYA